MTRVFIILWFSLFVVSEQVLSQDISETESQLAELKDDTTKINTLLKLGEYYSSRDFEKAQLYLQESLVVSTRLNYSKGIAYSFLYHGKAYYYKEEHDLAHSYVEKAKPVFEELQDKEGMANYHSMRGRIYILNGNYINALEHFQEVVNIGKQINHAKFIFDGYCMLGRVHLFRSEPEFAHPYLMEALKHSSGLGMYEFLCSQFADLYEGLEKYDSAYYYRNSHLEFVNNNNDLREIASSEYAMARLLNKMEEYQKAIKLLNSSIEKFTDLKDGTGICINAIELSKALLYTGDKAKSDDMGERAVIMAKETNNPSLLSYTYSNLAPVLAMNNNFEKAYNYMKLNNSIKESLDNINKERIIKELDVRYQTAKKDSEIQLLKSRNEVQRKNNLLLNISILALALIFLLLVVVFRLKASDMQRKLLLLEHEQTKHEHEQKIIDKEQQLLKEQLNTKNRELGSKALEMLRVNEIIREIIEKLEHLNAEEGNHANRSQLREISSSLETQLKNNSWTEFEKIFNNIHSDFFQNLLKCSPELTPTEIKVAALLKLNLNTKEIGAITFKSEAGIKSARYRLRQKLSLAKDENLVPFLMQI